jgi:hypothetical protein
MDPILLADIVVTVHLLFMLFVLLAQVLIVAGWLLRWAWVRNFWFRLVHLGSIGFVAGQALVGLWCPLTILERNLRLKGGAEGLHDLENASAIGRFCNETLFFPPSGPVFPIIYTSFALLVLLTWIFAPPRLPWRKVEMPATAQEAMG